jgi:short-subunit dehydrogenase
MKLITETDFVELTQMIHLNVVTVTQLTHLFLPQMIKNRRGGILNFGSVGGEVPSNVKLNSNLREKERE